MRLIDADEIMIKPEYMYDICGVVMIRAEDIARILNDMPTISSEPERKKGKWIPHEDEDGEYYGYDCSECGEWYVMLYGKTNFCPHCGSYNGGEQE